MSDMDGHFVEPSKVKAYLEKGPPAFTPGHAGMLQMAGVLLEERIGAHGTILVVGAGGGLELLSLAGVQPSWRFVGTIPRRRCWTWRAPRPARPSATGSD